MSEPPRERCADGQDCQRGCTIGEVCWRVGEVGRRLARQVVPPDSAESFWATMRAADEGLRSVEPSAAPPPVSPVRWLPPVESAARDAWDHAQRASNLAYRAQVEANPELVIYARAHAAAAQACAAAIIAWKEAG